MPIDIPSYLLGKKSGGGSGGGGDIVELTSPVRIADLDDGLYKVPIDCEIYYYGKTGTQKTTTFSTGYLFVTHDDTQKVWYLYSSRDAERLLRTGATTDVWGYTNVVSIGRIITDADIATTIDSSSTNNQVAGAKAVYDSLPTDFTGTDGVNAGTNGLVPAPLATDVDKFLKSDGTWAESGGGTTITYGTTDLTPRSITSK